MSPAGSSVQTASAARLPTMPREESRWDAHAQRRDDDGQLDQRHEADDYPES